MCNFLSLEQVFANGADEDSHQCPPKMGVAYDEETVESAHLTRSHSGPELTACNPCGKSTLRATEICRILKIGSFDIE